MSNRFAGFFGGMADLEGGHTFSLFRQEFCRLRAGKKWECVLSSNAKKFGGSGLLSYDPKAESASFDRPGALVLRVNA